jgi:hypothetical protein
MTTLFRKILLTFCTLQLIPMLLSAQGIGNTYGVLAGIAQVDGNALSGVLITVSGVKGEKITTTDSKGNFIFPYLTPGGYRIKAELQGFATIEQQNVQVNLGQRTEFTFQMQSDVHETITVNSEQSVVDLRKTNLSTTITDQLRKRIPIGRSIGDIIFLAPGVQDGGFGGANLSISGSSGLENVYSIDGVNVTNAATGAIGGQPKKASMKTNSFPVDTIQAVEVQTAAFAPEYGEALGGIVNVITKSGGNSFHGETHFFSNPQDPKDLTRGGNNLDTGGQIGGPILKNKVFFFAGYDLKRWRTNFLTGNGTKGFNEATTNSYVVKVNANLKPNHSFEFAASGDPGVRPFSNQDGEGLDDYLDPKGAESEWKWNTTSQGLNYNGILGTHTFVEARFGRSTNDFEVRPLDINLPAIKQGFLNLGGYGRASNHSSENNQYDVKFTNLWNNHQFRYGVEFQNIDYAEFVRRTGPIFTASNGQQILSGYDVFISNGVYTVRGRVFPQKDFPTISRYLDWFAQDSWNITPRINLTLGIRWERQQLKEDVSGAESFTFGNNWAPRIGGTYDYLGNGKSKVFANFGRYFQKIPNFLGVWLGPRINLIESYYDLELTNPVPGSIVLVPAGGADNGVEGHGKSSSSFHTRAQYSDEWVAGIEQEVRPDFLFGVRFVSRNLHGAFEDYLVREDDPCVNGDCLPAPLTLEEAANTNIKYFFTNLDGHIPGIPALERNYKALEITAEKRFADRWQLLGSYRYARLVGNFEGLFNREAELCCEVSAITGSGDFAVSSSIPYNYQSGPLPNDIRHMIKLYSSYQWGDRLNLGMSYNFQSGRPITKLAAIKLNDMFYRYVLLTPRAALGRTDSIHTFSIHGDYNFPLPLSQTISIGLDVFNLFNSSAATDIQQIAEASDSGPNPNFLKPLLRQEPRSFLAFLRYSF